MLGFLGGRKPQTQALAMVTVLLNLKCTLRVQPSAACLRTPVFFKTFLQTTKATVPGIHTNTWQTPKPRQEPNLLTLKIFSQKTNHTVKYTARLTAFTASCVGAFFPPVAVPLLPHSSIHDG